MAVDGQVTKRRKGDQKQREDRLSSLHDDILIRILSSIPIELAKSTGRLSRRWHGLWTNLTSIKKSFALSGDFHKGSIKLFDKTMKGITSPFVHTFIVEFLFVIHHSGWSSLNYLDSWLRQICDRNIRELKVICADGPVNYVFSLPSYIFQTRSLVSLKLDTPFCWQLPDDGPDLPNLKSLSINLSIVDWKWLEKLIKACMSLEELCLRSEFGQKKVRFFNCSNNNVTRLILEFGFSKGDKIMIDTPKLEYLSVRGPRYNLFSFESEDSEPIALREVDIKIVIKPLPLHISTRLGFRYVTRLTVHMAECYDINFVLTLVKSCPALNVLILQFWDIGRHGKSYSRPVGDSTPLQGIKRIDIEAYWETYGRPTKYFLKLVKYLIGNTRDLEHVRFKVVGGDSITGSVKRKQKRELNMCRRLYKYPIVSTMGCEVEFVGRLLNMSRKAGPKAWRGNGEVIPFDTNPNNS